MDVTGRLHSHRVFMFRRCVRMLHLPRLPQQVFALRRRLRRLLVRYEHLLSTYRAFFYLACLWIAVKLCLRNTL